MSGIAATGAITGGAQAALGMAPANVVGAYDAAAQGITSSIGVTAPGAADRSPVAADSPNAQAATGFDRQPAARHQAPQMTMAQAVYHATQAPPTYHADHAPAAQVARHADQAAAVASVYAAGRR